MNNDTEKLILEHLRDIRVDIASLGGKVETLTLRRKAAGFGRVMFVGRWARCAKIAADIAVDVFPARKPAGAIRDQGHGGSPVGSRYRTASPSGGSPFGAYAKARDPCCTWRRVRPALLGNRQVKLLPCPISLSMLKRASCRFRT